MKKLRAVAFFLVAALPAWAQTPPPISGSAETVYSEAERWRDEQMSRRFMQSLLRPSTRLEGQFARWKHPVCPRVFGLTPVASYVVERRIRDTAGRIGAPLDRRDDCVPNVRIFVSPDPQETLDALAAREIVFFEGAPLRELKVRYPVQSWYFGYIVDNNGVSHWDIDCWLHPLDPECGSGVASRGGRLTTGVKPDMRLANIFVDSESIKGLTLGSVGDYLALMSLAQAPARGRCQPAPSIANLFLKTCEADFHTSSLSEVDLAMLTALYLAPEEPEALQGNRIIRQMGRYLEQQHQK